MNIRIHYQVIAVGLLAFSGIVFFIVSLMNAIEAYPETWSWNQHFLSDPGRTRAEFLLDNSASSIAFNRVVILLGLSTGSFHDPLFPGDGLFP